MVSWVRSLQFENSEQMDWKVVFCSASLVGELWLFARPPFHPILVLLSVVSSSGSRNRDSCTFSSSRTMQNNQLMPRYSFSIALVSSTTSVSGTSQMSELHAWQSSPHQLPSQGEWFPDTRRCRRSRLMVSFSLLSLSAFGGLIATGVSYMSGKAGLYGWQWLVSSPPLRSALSRLSSTDSISFSSLSR